VADHGVGGVAAEGFVAIVIVVVAAGTARCVKDVIGSALGALSSPGTPSRIGDNPVV
jgi:hypothetical protein